MNNYDTQRPFLAANVILRKEGKIAFVLRANTGYMDGFYDLPSGKVEKGERLSLAGVREGGEEAGVKIVLSGLRLVHVMHRLGDSDPKEWLDSYFEADNYEGEPHNAEPHIHSELAWFYPDNSPDNIMPCVKFAIEQIESGKIYSEYGWD
jgi:8-oxo-dGTP diphosphatase